jgi:hypothetical protein
MTSPAGTAAAAASAAAPYLLVNNVEVIYDHVDCVTLFCKS